MTRLFGTDGVRGVANIDLTCELAYRLGQAAVVFEGDSVIIGRDTRTSGDMLEAAVVAGVTSAGGRALLAGIIPTPAIPLLVKDRSASAGIVISASHNPPEYNGIKLFDSAGFKLCDATEDRIEEFIVDGGLEAVCANSESSEYATGMPQGVYLGRSLELEDAYEKYIDNAVQSVRREGIDLSGMRIALDVAHGSSLFTSQRALARLGAEVLVINDNYNGNDINVDCGSTHLEQITDFVKECNADVGIAHDGDADRMMAVTPSGLVCDGDVIEAVCALDMKERGVLAGNAVVTTVLSNLGFVHAMNEAGIEVVQTKVGDRYVLEEMRAHGYVLGGEQSGHMIFLDYNTTGDGLVTAVQFLAAVKRAGLSFDEASQVIMRYPQVLINVEVKDKFAISANDELLYVVNDITDALGDEGRVVLRPSGTEPLIRVMVEAHDEIDAQKYAEDIAQYIRYLDDAK